MEDIMTKWYVGYMAKPDFMQRITTKRMPFDIDQSPGSGDLEEPK